MKTDDAKVLSEGKKKLSLRCDSFEHIHNQFTIINQTKKELNMKQQDENKNETIVSQNGTSKPVIRLIRTLQSYANIDYTFDESLVPNGIFREVYDYIKDGSDIPEQFIFTGVLAMLCGIVGTRVSWNNGVWKFKPHDYFILMAGSGQRKTTTLETVRNIIEDLEEKITSKDKAHNNVFLYPHLYPETATLKELIDLMCEEREDELYARTVAEKKGKPAPPPRVPQRSGVAIFDGVSELFVIKSALKAELFATLIDLWDGDSTSHWIGIRKGFRKGDVREFEDPALTVLSADIPRVLIERLSKNSFPELIFSRFQIINAKIGVRTRKSLGKLFREFQENRDEILKRYDSILEKLKQFYQFVCTLSQSQTPVLISDEAKDLDKKSAQMWYEERMDLGETTWGRMKEITGRYMNRIGVRMVRYALLFSVLECFEQHGHSADAITLTGTATQRAIEVCELFKKHTFHFLVKAKEIRPRFFNW